MIINRFLSELRLYFCNEWISKIPSHTIRVAYYKYFMGFNFGKHSTVLMRTTFDCARGLTVGNYSVINARCRIDTRGSITIGTGVSISSDVIILTADHEKDENGKKDRERPVVIHDYAWIGTRAIILPGVTIGRGAKIAAGAIVTKNVPPQTLVAGVPAKIIRTHEDEFCEQEDCKVYKRLFQ